MITVSATKLRSNLFEYLDKVDAGETVVIVRNQREVARISGLKKSDWRENMTLKPKLLVSEEELLKPLNDVFEAYV